MLIDAEAPEEGQALRAKFELAGRSLFPARKIGYLRPSEPMYESPWAGKSLTSLIAGDETEDVMEVLKRQHAYVIEQQNFLIQKQKVAQLAASQNQVQSIQEQQIALVRDMLNGFQESMNNMMQMASDMVQKVVEAPAIMAEPTPQMPSFEKSAVSHKRPAIRPRQEPAVMQGNLALKVEQGLQDNVHPSDAKTIRVQPHPISKKLERVGEK